ncbi:L-aminoadipate-semialdehyde dehydrogenase-phosphopantetheinyl transferase-like isoform X3 [Benincasa hispida]|uniref:L-aminoadipate-semialdehyde dehydrogenase-phosphopantetheinyl transferase-like isoform X3 n=1 Tax=Benincasa hispida TaxID=102211 RepID=UPI001901E862|nr:L-aminoadipate-semialdehyde dehydrogenase-phosphopantetheinyl transferase-like isoform X3 [Benincasa hispida]
MYSSASMFFSSLHRASTATNMHFFQRSFATAASHIVPMQLPSKMVVYFNDLWPLLYSASTVWWETHIWYILPDEVKSIHLQNHYLNLLSPNEKENVLKIQEGEVQKRALLARALVRSTISRYLTQCQIDPQALKFKKNMFGKPELDLQNSSELCLPPLQFNISHSSSLIACGVTLHSPIGIDVEEKTRKIKNNIIAFAKRFFSPNEIEVLSAISDPERQRQEFIKLWTLKEAYVKALGRGFSAVPFNTFTIRFDKTATGSRLPGCKTYEACEISVESCNDPENCSSNVTFALMELSGSHYAAVCMEKDTSFKGAGSLPMKLNVWRTIPYVEDECVSGTEAALPINGFAQANVKFPQT